MRLCRGGPPDGAAGRGGGRPGANWVGRLALEEWRWSSGEGGCNGCMCRFNAINVTSVNFRQVSRVDVRWVSSGRLFWTPVLPGGPADLTIGGSRSVSKTGLRRWPLLVLTFGLLAVLMMSVTSSAGATGPETVGESLVSRDYIDSVNTAFVYKVGFGPSAVGHSIDTWGFYAGGFAEPTVPNGHSVTPLLLENTGGNNYILRAIGRSRTIGSGGIGLGLNADLPFDTQEGDATILNGSYFFGWKDGAQIVANPLTPKGGVISFNRPGGFPH